MYNIITLDQIKSWLKLTTTTDHIELMQKVVTDIAESLMQQFGIVREITEYQDGNGNNILLVHQPVYSIVDLNDDVDYLWTSTTDITSVNFIIKKSIGELFLINNYSSFLKGKGNVQIIYRVGFSRFKVITGVNDSIDFDEGSALKATIASGVYDAEDLATAIATAMNSAGALIYTCTYSHNTQKFTIIGSSTLDWLWATGVNLSTTIANLINVAETDISANTTTTSGEVTGIPFDIVNACQQIVFSLDSMGKQGLGIQMIKTKEMMPGGSSGKIEYYGDQLPTIAVNILKSKRRIGL